MAAEQKSNQEDIYLKKAVRGDRTGLEYLVSNYTGLAYTIAIKILGNKEDAEEVVQDSFMKAFKAIGKFKKSSKFSTWLYRIVYNTAITKRRNRKTSIVSLDNAPMVEVLSKIEEKEWDGLLQDDKQKFLDLAMNNLSVEERLILTLHYIMEKNISEISTIMNLKKSAIKMRLLRARKQLKIELELLLGDETKNLL